MTRVGNYTFSKTAAGYALSDKHGEVVSTHLTARAANAEGFRLTALAYKKSSK